MQIQIDNTQQTTVTLNPVDENGNPAAIDGVPTWVVVDGLSTVIPAADGKSAVLRSEDGIGVTNFKVDADADLGGGVVDISANIELTVITPQATDLGLVAGTPTHKT